MTEGGYRICGKKYGADKVAQILTLRYASIRKAKSKGRGGVVEDTAKW